MCVLTQETAESLIVGVWRLRGCDIAMFFVDGWLEFHIRQKATSTRIALTGRPSETCVQRQSTDWDAMAIGACRQTYMYVYWLDGQGKYITKISCLEPTISRHNQITLPKR